MSSDVQCETPQGIDHYQGMRVDDSCFPAFADIYIYIYIHIYLYEYSDKKFVGLPPIVSVVM